MSRNTPVSARRRIARVAGVSFTVMLLLLAAISQLAQSKTALEWATAKLVAASGERLSITGTRGSLAGALTIDRVMFKDATVKIVVSNIRFDWQPSALLMRQVSIATLAAEDVEVTLIPSAAGPADNALPDSLALPIEVNVDHLRIDRLKLHSGESHRVFLGIQSGYAGDATRHRFSNLAFQSDFGTVGGEIGLAAAKPFELNGVLDWSLGEGASKIFAHATLGGTLNHISSQLSGGVGALALSGTAIAAPFGDSWLPELHLVARDANLASITASFPTTALSGKLNAGTDQHGRLAGTLNLVNSSAGTLTDERLPLAALMAQIAVDGGAFRFDQVQGSLGAGGSVTGSGRISGSGTELDIALANVDLRAIHKPLRTTKLNGRVKATLAEGKQNFELTLEERRLKLAAIGTIENNRMLLHSLTAKAGKGEFVAKGELSLTTTQALAVNSHFARFDPSEFGDFPEASISGSAEISGQLSPEWRTEVRIAFKDSTFRGTSLSGSGTFKISAHELREAKVDLSVGKNHLRGQGSIGNPGDTLELAFDGHRLEQLNPQLAGMLVANAKIGGTLKHPRLAFEAKSDSLAFGRRFAAEMFDARGSWSSDEDPRIELKTKVQKLTAGAVTFDTFAVDVTGALAVHTITLGFTAPGVALAAELEGGVRAAAAPTSRMDRRWTGRVTALTNHGNFPFQLLSPASLEAGPAYIALGETTADLAGGRLSLRSLRLENGRLSSLGNFTGVPVSPLLALAGMSPQPGSDLTLRGAWTIDANPRLNGTLSVARETGDLIVLPDSTSRIGLKELNLEAKIVDDTVRGSLAVQASDFGMAKFEVAVVPPAGGEPFAPQSALSGNAQLNIANLQLLDNWIGTAALVDGVILAQLGLAGTLAQPLVTGTLEGDRIRFDVPQQGVALKNGRLRAELNDRALVLQEFSIAGPTGTLSASGTLARRDSDGESQIEWRANDLQLLDRPDQRLTVAGNGTIGMSKDRLVLRGALKALKGNIEFERPHSSSLGDDVVVVGRKAKPEKVARRATSLDLDAMLDFGEHFKIAGAGLETGLQGKLRVHTSTDGALLAAGKLRTVGGSYFAFGQKLTIERGQLYFDGPLSNPGLEILAVRKNLPVEAGVEVTGTARSPRVQLTSNPPVPDGEKLSWLVTGRGLDSASATDFGLLQAAAGSLINSSQSIPQTHLIARKIGLDDIGVRASGTGASTGATGGEALAIGKSLSDKVYLEYEKGLDVASNVLRLNYQLSRAFSLRVESGVDSAIGVFYRRSFD